MLINEVPILDNIVKAFVETARFVTGDFVDEKDGFWSEFTSKSDLYKICSIPAYIKLRNKQMLLKGVPERDLIAGGETLEKMQRQIDAQCLLNLSQECRKLLSMFFDGKKNDQPENKMLREIKKKLK